MERIAAVAAYLNEEDENEGSECCVNVCNVEGLLNKGNFFFHKAI